MPLLEACSLSAQKSQSNLELTKFRQSEPKRKKSLSNLKSTGVLECLGRNFSLQFSDADATDKELDRVEDIFSTLLIWTSESESA